MPTPLVVDVRSRIRQEDRSLTPVERALLLATIAKPAEGSRDPLDELRAAIAGARSSLAHLGTAEAAAVRRLLAASVTILDAAPPGPAVTATIGAGLRGSRAAVRHWSEVDAEDAGRPASDEAALAWAAAR